MPTTWTTRTLLTWMAQDFSALGLGTPRLDAELLIAHVLGVDRVRLYMDLDRPLTAAELAAVRALVVRRRQREPVAYLIGRREFYLRAFAVSKAVLIPRPETEGLVERALALLPADAPQRVLDLCTGSGAIAVTLAAERPLTQLVATDVSAEALAVARENAARHGVAERIAFCEGDLFAALQEPTTFDLIVANPPYISEPALGQLAPELQHEPRLALISGSEGLDVLERLCREAPAWLRPSGALLFEIGAGQAPTVLAHFQAMPELTAISAHRDLAGIERVVEAHRRDDGVQQARNTE